MMVLGASNYTYAEATLTQGLSGARSTLVRLGGQGATVLHRT